jgi:hypothetical protein
MEQDVPETFADVGLETRDQDSLMLIETNTRRDIVMSVILFVLVVGATTFAGISGPLRIQEERSRLILDPSNNIMNLLIPRVSPRNQFLTMTLAFETSSAGPTSINISLSYLIIFFHEAREVRREQAAVARRVEFSADVSEDGVLFFDRYLSYERIDLRIEFHEFGGIAAATLTWTMGEVRHLSFQFWIRGAFGIASFATLLIYWQRLRAVPWRSWTMEQKVTLFLNVCSVVGINPLFVFYVASPNLLRDILNTFAFRFFRAYVLLFMLIVIDNLNGKQTFAPKVLFFCIQLVSEMAHTLVSRGSEVLGIEAIPHEFLGIISTVRVCIYALFITWFALLVLKTMRIVDRTDLFRLVVYVIVFALVLLCNLSAQVLVKSCWFRTTSALFTLHLSSLHSFVLLMIFAHWPYNYNIDEVYNTPESENAKDQTIHDLLEPHDQTA